MHNESRFFVIPVVGAFGLAVIAALYVWVRNQDPGTERMQEMGFIVLLAYLIGGAGLQGACLNESISLD